jgi:hypothetical protein
MAGSEGEIHIFPFLLYKAEKKSAYLKTRCYLVLWSMKNILPSVWTLSSHPSGSGPRSSWCRLTTIHLWSTDNQFKGVNSSGVKPDLHNFGNLDPDPHQGDKPDPDPHQAKSQTRSGSASNKNRDSDPLLSDKSDPDLHSDPQHWKSATGSMFGNRGWGRGGRYSTSGGTSVLMGEKLPRIDKPYFIFFLGPLDKAKSPCAKALKLTAWMLYFQQWLT